MADSLHRIAVLTHHVPAVAGDALRQLAGLSQELGLELFIPAEEHAKHPWAEQLGYRVIDEHEMRTVDACVVFGGDGTILRALGRLLGSDVPTLGVNYGHVGFLASLTQGGWRSGFAQVASGSYNIAQLLTVEARLGGQRFVAVNDIVLSRRQPRGVLHFEYAISGTPVGDMRCDGMIIASPTGSTAYNLSCDGPLVVWDANVLVLNFVAPHSLGFRPIVLRPDHVIDVRNVSDHDEPEVVVDGASATSLGVGETIQISASSQRARLLVREGVSFYRNVEEKLFGFGADAH